MSEQLTGHTPGPWIVKGHPDGLLCVTDEDSRYVVDRFILGGRPAREHLANAHLIAAAPDLLVACLKLLEASNVASMNKVYEAIDMARLAVTMAKVEAS